MVNISLVYASAQAPTPADSKSTQQCERPTAIKEDETGHHTDFVPQRNISLEVIHLNSTSQRRVQGQEKGLAR